jgi:hypothetical protein
MPARIEQAANVWRQLRVYLVRGQEAVDQFGHGRQRVRARRVTAA